MSSKVKTISKQHPKTWAQLHKRLIPTAFDYGSVFSPSTSEFVLKKASSINSNAGYLISALLTTTLFVLSLSAKLTTYNGFQTILNIYTIFVGPPSTGKSQAFKAAASFPLNELITDKELIGFLIKKTTPSGLFKKLSSDKQGFLLSPEIYDVLIRLLKTDDGCTGDISLLCELFSGEGALFTMATQTTRTIPPDAPFSILGSTQLPPLAKLLVTMDEGQGLLDRFFILTPECFRPTPDETTQGNDFIQRQHIKSFVEFVSVLYDLHLVPKQYYFSNDAKLKLKVMETEFVTALNDAIRTGSVPPKSKTIDIVQRLALAIHVTDHIMAQLLADEKTTPPPLEIHKDTLQKAFQLTNYSDMQKEILNQVRIHYILFRKIAMDTLL